MQANTFDEVLGLEEQFYDDGFRQGYADGLSAGRIEGRTFGLETTFEKYVEAGKLYGKSLVWSNRLSSSEISQTQKTAATLPPLPANQRLVKHVKVLHALSEAASLSTQNTDDAVSDFDDRLKRGQAKAKVIERITGESKGENDGKEEKV